MLAKKIKMMVGCYSSQLLLEIDEIYLDGCATPGYYKKASVHDYLITHPNTIQVDIYPYPNLIPMISSNGEKFVKSTANSSQRDNLLSLPRE